MRVAIVMGSTSDLSKVEPAITILKESSSNEESSTKSYRPFSFVQAEATPSTIFLFCT